MTRRGALNDIDNSIGRSVICTVDMIVLYSTKSTSGPWLSIYAAVKRKRPRQAVKNLLHHKISNRWQNTCLNKISNLVHLLFTCTVYCSITYTVQLPTHSQYRAVHLSSSHSVRIIRVSVDKCQRVRKGYAPCCQTVAMAVRLKLSPNNFQQSKNDCILYATFTNVPWVPCPVSLAVSPMVNAGHFPQ